MGAKKTSVEEILARAKRWAEEDVVEADGLAVHRAIEALDLEFLLKGFKSPLDFGTAGLRGGVGPGPGQMNCSLVTKVSWALGEFLNKLRPGVVGALVVIGFDARPESSLFASFAAAVLRGQGARVVLSDKPMPTPVIAFSVRHLRAQAGIVVTASHNPRGDNGFKVYDDQGIQIVTPWDTEIATLFRASPAAASIARLESGIEGLDDQVVESYLWMVQATAKSWVPFSEQAERGSFPVAYTPLHGVGAQLFERALSGFRSLQLLSVKEQREPDGTFPTVPFPNPEEEGALDLLLQLGKANKCEAAFAHDPDADRFALCLPLGGETLTRLSGDAVALLFLDSLFEQSFDAPRAIVSTVVSSPAAKELTLAAGHRFVQTLTGFKWLCHAASEEENFAFAYEEALGYCFRAPAPFTTVMDKDGLLAGVCMARMIAREGGGRELAKRLLAIYKRIGQWGSFISALRLEGDEGKSRMESYLSRIRKDPPHSLGELRVSQVEDFSLQMSARPWYCGQQDLIAFDLVAQDERSPVREGRVLLRPSGTEAKLKLYLHLKSNYRGEAQFPVVQALQGEMAGRIARELFDAEE